MGFLVMVWDCFYHYGRSSIEFLNGKNKFEYYLELMESNMIPMAHTCNQENLVYMQEKALILTSRKSLKWFTKNGVALLPWLENFPDLKTIENI